jgi:hypothetical protein
MKKIVVVALLVAGSLMQTPKASAKATARGHYQAIQYAAPPVPIHTVCNVNGVAYPVDFGSRIWGRNAYDEWFVIGRIVVTPAGYIAIRLDGVTFPASCE